MSDTTLNAMNNKVEVAEKKYLRFTLIQRLEHWIFMLSFSTLGLTGLVQKFASAGISKTIMTALGGIETTRSIHHVAAIIMMLSTVYHIGTIGYKMYVERTRLTMLPELNDARRAWESMLYYLGFRKNPVQQGRYTFEEKAEYWAVVWGTVVMVVTGFIMWNPIATTQFLPGEVVPAAKAAHGGEAILAVLAIILWHLYHVLVKTFNRSMFNGYLSEEQMLHEHPLELADVKAGLDKRPLDPRLRSRRIRVFSAVYGILAVVLLYGVYEFVTFERTAVTTVPPAENVVVFAPYTPTPLPTPHPTATPVPIVAVTWEGGVSQVFEQKCSTCHGASKIGGLDVTTYQGILAGGNKGPAIEPGNPDGGSLITLQKAGGHPGQLGSTELTLIIDWVSAGAPEK